MDTDPLSLLTNPFISVMSYIQSSGIVLSVVTERTTQNRKIPKAIVMYTSACNRFFEAKDQWENLKCSKCNYFIPDKKECQIVCNESCPDEDFISPDSWCLFWNLKTEDI